MVALRRPQVLVPAVLVVAALIVGVVAMKSHGSDAKTVTTTKHAINCAPIAHADAAITKPGTPVAIDVLANDTDPDGDLLVFQILKTDGGTSTIDDGGTPTDASDDRLQFTPADPSTDSATIEYQALDPQGGFGASTVAVYVNPTATLPDGVHSEAATDPVPDGTDAGGRCGAPTSSTVLDHAGSGPTTSVVEPTPVSSVDASTSPTSTGRHTTTTKKTTANATTTTAKRSTDTTGNGSAATTQPSQPSTTRKPTTTTTPHSDTTTPNACGSPDPSSPNYNPHFKDCVRGSPSP